MTTTTLFRLVVLVASLWKVAPQDIPEVTPLSFNASLGSADVTFNCFLEGATFYLWMIDGLTQDDQEIQDREISTTITDGQGILTIPATQENDNTTLQCQALRGVLHPGPIQYGALLIQGLLDPPPNLNITEIDSALRQLSWDAPFTLDITNVEQDIMMYILCENVTGVCRNTTDLEYVFPNVAVPVEFTVAAVNVVGEGNTSSVVHEPCQNSPTGLSGVEVTVTVMFQNGNPAVNLEYAQDSDCFNILTVEVINSTLQYAPFIPIVREQESLSLVSVTIDSGLSANEVFMITVIPLGVFGEGNSSEVIHFTTFDVQDVNISSGPGLIIVICTFAEGSTAQGCHVVISIEGMQDITRNVTRSLEQQTATAQISGLFIGTYTVSVFDIEEDGSVNVGNPVRETREVDIIEPAPSTSVTLLPLSTGSASTQATTSSTVMLLPTVTVIIEVPTGGARNDDNTAAIAGGAIGGFILVLLVVIISLGLWIYCSTRQTSRHKSQESYGYTNTDSSIARLVPATQAGINEIDGSYDPTYAQPGEGTKKGNITLRHQQGEDLTDSPVLPRHSPALPRHSPRPSPPLPHSSPALPLRPPAFSQRSHSLPKRYPLPPLPKSTAAPPQYETIDKKFKDRVKGEPEEQKSSVPGPLYEEAILPGSLPISCSLMVEDSTYRNRRRSSLPPDLPPRILTEEDIRELNLPAVPDIPPQQFPPPLEDILKQQPETDSHDPLVGDDVTITIETSQRSNEEVTTDRGGHVMEPTLGTGPHLLEPQLDVGEHNSRLEPRLDGRSPIPEPQLDGGDHMLEPQLQMHDEAQFLQVAPAAEPVADTLEDVAKALMLQYVKIEHPSTGHRPKDKTGVFYSEIQLTGKPEAAKSPDPPDHMYSNIDEEFEKKSPPQVPRKQSRGRRSDRPPPPSDSGPPVQHKESRHVMYEEIFK